MSQLEVSLVSEVGVRSRRVDDLSAPVWNVGTQEQAAQACSGPVQAVYLLLRTTGAQRLNQEQNQHRVLFHSF